MDFVDVSTYCVMFEYSVSFADAPIMSVCFLLNQGKFSVLPSTCPLFITVLGCFLSSCKHGQVGESVDIGVFVFKLIPVVEVRSESGVL